MGASAMAPARILVVEDDRVVARDIQAKLRRIGHEVVGYTARGEDAVSLAISKLPDLILMDVRLEGALDGIEAARQIRDQCQLPVVFLTAYADDETVRRASVTEPFGYLMKPFDDSQLRTIVEMAIYKHGAERRLLESERRYATTLSSIADAVVATDERSIITFMNPSAEQLTGWKQQEAVGVWIHEVLRIVTRGSHSSENPRLAVMQERKVSLDAGTMLVTRSGKQVHIDLSSSPIRDDRGRSTGAVVVLRDMTERNEAQERVRKVQQELAHVGRVSALGQLTVSIAHEMNQPLMAIMTNSAACLMWLTPDRMNLDEAREAAERVIEDARRAGEVIASIRSLARKADGSTEAQDLNALVLEVQALLQTEWRRLGITADFDLSQSAFRVRGNRVQLQQLVLNLLMNAMDAINAADNGSKLLKLTSEDDASGFVKVTVEDTGQGLDAEIEERIFDAFFTTKSHGIGMGLSICRSIVEAHGGRLWFTRNHPSGSRFHFTIPKVVEERQALSQRVAHAEPEHG